MPKRPSVATASGAMAPKVAKTAKPSEPILQVAKGLAASDLPKVARDMLQNMLGNSLDVCKEKRDKLQSKVVDLVGGVLSAHGEALKTRVEESETLISQGAQENDELDSKVDDKESEVQTTHIDVVAKKQELAEAARSFWSARQAMDEATAKAQTDEVEAIGRVTEKETLASLLNDFQNHAAGPVDDLVKRIEAVGANESMVMALPAMLSKPASERGSFDAMIFTSVQEWLESRVAAADEAIQNAEPTKAANADALGKADTRLQERREQQLDGADAYWKVHTEEAELENEVRLLRQSIRKLREASRKHKTMSTRAQLALSTFQNGPKSAFELLRDRAEEFASAGDAEAEQAGDTAMGADQEAATEVEGADVDATETAGAS